MKATRAAIKTAKNIEELAAEMAEMRGQLNRIEDMLTAKAEAVEEVPEVAAKPAAKSKGK